jgi:hypothetical protein
LETFRDVKEEAECPVPGTPRFDDDQGDSPPACRGKTNTSSQTLFIPVLRG